VLFADTENVSMDTFSDDVIARHTADWSMKLCNRTQIGRFARHSSPTKLQPTPAEQHSRPASVIEVLLRTTVRVKPLRLCSVVYKLSIVFLQR